MKSVKFNKTKSVMIEEPKSVQDEKSEINKPIIKWDFDMIKNKIWEIGSEIKVLVLNKKTIWKRLREQIKNIKNEIKQIKNGKDKKELKNELKSVLEQYKLKSITEGEQSGN